MQQLAQFKEDVLDRAVMHNLKESIQIHSDTKSSRRNIPIKVPSVNTENHLTNLVTPSGEKRHTTVKQHQLNKIFEEAIKRDIAKMPKNTIKPKKKDLESGEKPKYNYEKYQKLPMARNRELAAQTRFVCRDDFQMCEEYTDLRDQ